MSGCRIVSRGENTTVLEREVAGSVLQFVLHLGEGDRGSFLRQSQAGLVAHRGHSTELTKTFPVDVADPVPRTFLMLALSCGGFRDLSGLLDTYPGAFPIAATQVGRGAVNNAFMYYLAEALALGREGQWDWERLRAHVAAHMPADQLREFMFPHDLPVLLLRVPEPSPSAASMGLAAVAWVAAEAFAGMRNARGLSRRRLIRPWRAQRTAA